MIVYFKTAKNIQRVDLDNLETISFDGDMLHVSLFEYESSIKGVNFKTIEEKKEFLESLLKYIEKSYPVLGVSDIEFNAPQHTV